ncbi:hypothetical protein [Nostoc sp.]|uniref:hypothetical protein n=1 Tax=Nostoc sp. TaxID=1180 RepID=UPI002FFD4011
MDFEPHINAVSTEVRCLRRATPTHFPVMNADNYPKIISVSLQLRFETADRH